MTTRQIPAVRGIDPAVAKILGPIRDTLLELTSGPSRVVRVTELVGNGFEQNGDSLNFKPIVVPSVASDVQRSIEQIQAAQTDISTLADELLGTARFGSVMAAKVAQAKTLKVNVNGHIAGYGIAVYGGAAGPTTSDFVIQSDRFSVVFPSPAWQANSSYAQGQYVTPTEVGANFIYECTTAGETGAAEPTWPTVAGQTVDDGAAVWTCRTIDQRVPFVVGNINGSAEVGIDGNLVVDGTIQANAIQALAITADKIASQSITAEKLATNLVLTQSVEIAAGGKLFSGQTAYNTGIGWFWGYDGAGTPIMSIGNSGGNRVTWDGATLTVVGNVSGALDAASITGDLPISAVDISAQGWATSCVFSADDDDTVSWAAGQFKSAAGDLYNIVAGTTGNMTGRTYVYLDLAASQSAFQRSTDSLDAIGKGKVLIAVAQNQSDRDAFFQVYGGYGGIGGVGGATNFSELAGTLNLDTQVSGVLTKTFAASGLINGNITINGNGTLNGAGGGQASLTSLPGKIQAGSIAANAVTAAEIAALSITAAKIAASTITGDKIAANSITAALIAANAITANELAANSVTANAIAAGVIDAGKLAATLTLTNALIISTNGYMRSGQTGYDSGIGWFLGDVAGTSKFSIGNSAGNKLTWNGSALQIAGDLLTASETGTFSTTLSVSGSPTVSVSYKRTGDKVSLVFGTATGIVATFGGFFAFLPSNLIPQQTQVKVCWPLYNDQAANSQCMGIVEIMSTGTMRFSPITSTSGWLVKGGINTGHVAGVNGTAFEYSLA